MENSFEGDAEVPAEPGAESPLDAETPSLPADKQALLDSLESAVLAPGYQTISPTGWRMRSVCPFCPADFGTCSHPVAVNPITEASAP
jgi:hypothetical protein